MEAQQHKKYQDLRNIIEHIISLVRADHTICLDIVEYIEVVLNEHDKKSNMNNDQIKAFVDQTIEIQELKKTIQDLTAELEEYRSIAEKVGAEKAVSDKAKWEELADKLIGFAELIRHIEGNDTRNAAYYNAAGEAIEQYKKLKEE